MKGMRSNIPKFGDVRAGWADRLNLPPISGADDGGPVDRAEYERVVEQSRKRESLLERAKEREARLRDELAAVAQALAITLPAEAEGAAILNAVHEKESQQAQELTTARRLVEQRTRELRGQLIEGALRAAGIEHRLTQRGIDYLLLKYRDQFDAVEEDGRLIVKAKTEGAPGPSEFVAALATDPTFFDLVQSAGTRGGGTSGTPAPTGQQPLKVSRHQLEDPVWYAQHRDEIDKARREGRAVVTE